MKRTIYNICVAAIAIIAIASCSKEPQWSVSGKIDGANGGRLALESASARGYWGVVDTVSIGSDGSFKIQQEAPTYPAVYRLNYGGRYIYFPIDSLEQLTVSTTADKFGLNFTVEGSEAAKTMTEADKMINKFMASHSLLDIDTARQLKRNLGNLVLKNPEGIESYYIVGKHINGRPVFRTDNRKDLAIIGAVANAYSEKRPGAPQTEFLNNLWIQNRRQFITNSSDTVVAPTISIIDIDLADNNGKKQTLSSVAESNKVTILNFTAYKQPYSNELNLMLRDLYDTYHATGLEIYQVGFDANEFDWRMAANKLPWITVYNGSTDRNLVNYNVGDLPAIFIFVNGELVERATTMNAARLSVARYIK